MPTQYVNRTCPICGGYVVLLTNGTELCEKCHYTLSGSNNSISTSSNKYCERCNTKLVPYGNWWECPNCHYGYMLTTSDPIELTEEYVKEMAKKITDTSLFIPSDSTYNVGTAISSIEPNALTITNCEKFKVQLKEIDIEFELDPNKLENIDTIIINGYKYIKDK